MMDTTAVANKNCAILASQIGCIPRRITIFFGQDQKFIQLDHFILEKLKPEGYVRYMDDMVIFGDSVKNLKNIFDEVDRFCLEKLALFLKIPVFGKTFRGVPFLGWRITKDRIFLLSKTKRRMKNRLKEIQKSFERGKITEEKAVERTKAVCAARVC